jgi:hypothetical protein
VNWPPSAVAWAKICKELPAGADPAKFRAAVDAAVRIYMSAGPDPKVWERIAELARSKVLQKLRDVISELDGPRSGPLLQQWMNERFQQYGGDAHPEPENRKTRAPSPGSARTLAEQYMLRWAAAIPRVQEIAEQQAQLAKHHPQGIDPETGRPHSAALLERRELLYSNLLIACTGAGGFPSLSDSDEGPLTRIVHQILRCILPNPLTKRGVRDIIRRAKQRSAVNKD